jgi:hypothetical protein
MQTFLPYPDFAKSAAVLDNKRLGKQRVECLQILTALRFGPYQRACNDSIFQIPKWESCPEREWQDEPSTFLYRRTPWYNHPATKMWKAYPCTLLEYGTVMCREWCKRGFDDTCEEKMVAIHYGQFGNGHVVTDVQHGCNELMTDWLGREDIHASHRSNLLRKNPQHYAQFGWTESADLPYVWPV